MTPARTHFSRRLVELREQHDPPLSQQEAADLIGLSLRQYGRLERGQADATLATIRKVADAYSVQPYVLTGASGAGPIVGGQVVDAADLARLEAKIDVLLEHFDLIRTDKGLPALPSDVAAGIIGGYDRPPSATARARRRHVTSPRR